MDNPPDKSAATEARVNPTSVLVQLHEILALLPDASMVKTESAQSESGSGVTVPCADVGGAITAWDCHDEQAQECDHREASHGTLLDGLVADALYLRRIVVRFFAISLRPAAECRVSAFGLAGI